MAQGGADDGNAYCLSACLLFSKVVWAALVYWALCFFTASFHENMRFSTLGYLGMFLMTYIVFYHLVYTGAFTLAQFKKLLKFCCWLIVPYCYCNKSV